MSLYCIGEYGEKLVIQSSENPVSERQVYDLIVNVFQKFPDNDDIKEYGMNCLIKLVPKYTSLSQDLF